MRLDSVIHTASWLAMSALSICGAPAHAAGDAAAGKTVFANQCASCHTTEVGKNGFGPSLAAVVGRKAGGLAGFTYSPAMAQAGLIWDEKNLDEFLTSSTVKVPGTSMPVALPSASDRANVIAYLETFGRASAAAASAPAAASSAVPSIQGPTQNEFLHAAQKIGRLVGIAALSRGEANTLSSLVSVGATPSSLPRASRARASNSFRLGNSSRSLRPKRIRNSLDVL